MAKSNEELNSKLAGKQVEAAKSGNQETAVTVKNLNTWIDAFKPQFEKALAGVMDSDRFVRLLISEVRGSATIMEIAIRNPQTLIAAAMDAAALGLDFSVPNEVFLVPFKSELVAMPGYKGLQKLATESARDAGMPLIALSADEICENDVYEREKGSCPYVIHKLPKFGQPRGAVLGYVAVSKDAAGRIDFVEMTVEEVKKHKARFCKSTGDKGPWAHPENDDAYGRKTVMRKLVNKALNMSAKLGRAVSSLNRIEDEIPNVAATVISTEAVSEGLKTGEGNNGKENSSTEERQEGQQRPEDASS